MKWNVETHTQGSKHRLVEPQKSQRVWWGHSELTNIEQRMRKREKPKTTKKILRRNECSTINWTLVAAESVCKWSLGFLLLLLRLVHIASSSISLRLWNETRKICDSRNQTKTNKSWECRRTSNISRVRWLKRSSIKTRQSRYRGDSRLTIVKSLNKHIKWLTEPFLFFALSTISLSSVYFHSEWDDGLEFQWAKNMTIGKEKI